MSLKPIRSSKHLRKRAGAYRSIHSRQQWKPWKGWTGSVIKKNLLGLFGRKIFVLLLIGLAITIGFGVMYADPNNRLFHSYMANPDYLCVPTAYQSGGGNVCGDTTTTIFDETTGAFSDDFNFVRANYAVGSESIDGWK